MKWEKIKRKIRKKRKNGNCQRNRHWKQWRYVGRRQKDKRNKIFERTMWKPNKSFSINKRKRGTRRPTTKIHNLKNPYIKGTERNMQTA
jgi:hypothetical protein